eukprot:m.474230 g.474230  ORF g.474230 m.474230 type:complete len:322 (+) comp20390_c5_seq2:3029-3994(+)
MRGQTAMQLAAGRGHLDVVKLLLSLGDRGSYQRRAALLYQADGKGCTALLMAADEGRVEVVRWLIHEAKAPVTPVCRDGLTAVHLAARNGHLDTLKVLAPFDRLSTAIGASDSGGNTALLHAAKHGHLHVVQWLVLDCGVPVTQTNKNGSTALLLAAEGGHHDVVEWLLEPLHSGGGGGVGVSEQTDKEQNSALLLAARAGHGLLVEWLLDSGHGSIVHDKNELGRTVLLEAAAHNQLHVVKSLLDDSAPWACASAALLQQTDGKGYTALHLAASEGYLSVVQWLVDETKATTTTTCNDGATAVELAARHGHLETLRPSLG